MSVQNQPTAHLFSLFQKIVDAIFDSYQILRAERSYTNEIIDFSVLYEIPRVQGEKGSIRLSDYRMLYALKKSLNSHNQGRWISLSENMMLPLSNDEILVVPFDSHNHQPKSELLSMVMGFDGVTHVISQRLSQRLISEALEKLLEKERPFAFGILNIDNFEAKVADLQPEAVNEALDGFADSVRSRLGENGTLVSLQGNEFAIIMECKESINELFPTLVSLSELSLTRENLRENGMKMEFSAGYVLVTNPFVTVNEILDEATALMYKSKSDGKNGYGWSHLHHSANEPST